MTPLTIADEVPLIPTDELYLKFSLVLQSLSNLSFFVITLATSVALTPGKAAATF